MFVFFLHCVSGSESRSESEKGYFGLLKDSERGGGGGREDLKERRERKRSWWRGEFSKARGHVNLGKM